MNHLEYLRRARKVVYVFDRNKIEKRELFELQIRYL